MRLTYNFLLALLVLTTNIPLYAGTEIINGDYSCITDDSDEFTETVVTFINGIKNDQSQAEASRASLQSNLLRYDVCNRSSNCKVQKFYNQTDGAFNDVQELNYVGNLEQAAANLAIMKTLNIIVYDYKRYVEINTDESLAVSIASLGKEYDDEIFTELDKLYGMAREYHNNNISPFLGFEEVDFSLSEEIIEHLIEITEISSIESNYSIYLKLLRERKSIYDLQYNSHYQKNISQYYLSDREFYGDNADANVALTRTVEGFVSYLENLIMSGKKVVIVAHSQGNHITALAYSVLLEKWGESVMRAVQVVGVASVAASTPSNTYLTWDQDHTVLNVNNIANNSLPGNFKELDGQHNSIENDSNDHSFNDVYMNNGLTGHYTTNNQGNFSEIQEYLSTDKAYPLPEWIAGLVKGSMETAVPYTPDSTQANPTGFVTASLRWEVQPDLDLLVREKDENGESLLTPQNPLGGNNSGLDKDDTDGGGPERYTANITCEAAENKEFSFILRKNQNISVTEPAIAYFSLGVGNNILVQKTHAPECALSVDTHYNLGSVKFGQLQSGKIPYTITTIDVPTSVSSTDGDVPPDGDPPLYRTSLAQPSDDNSFTDEDKCSIPKDKSNTGGLDGDR